MPSCYFLLTVIVLPLVQVSPKGTSFCIIHEGFFRGLSPTIQTILFLNFWLKSFGHFLGIGDLWLIFILLIHCLGGWTDNGTLVQDEDAEEDYDYEVVLPDRHDTWKSSLSLERYHDHTIDRGCDQDVLEITSIKSFVCMRFHSLQCKWFIYFNMVSLFGWEFYMIFNIE